MKNPLLAPSLLAADFYRLDDALAFIEQKGGALVHIDVMDGVFVSQISYGQPVVRKLKPHSSIPFDVHLMVAHPENHIDSFAEAGADYITFHWEAAVHHHRIIESIHRAGKKAGIAFVPSTPVSVLKEVLPFVDIVLVMTVDPGFGGQHFIFQCADKIAELVSLRAVHGWNYLISVDGGINTETAVLVSHKGADIIVSGSSFFNGLLEFPVSEGASF